MFRIEKKKIFLIYQQYLLEKKEKIFEKDEWFDDFKIKIKDLEENIESKLKEDWKLSRIPPLEKAVLVYAYYEITKKKEIWKIIIDQIVNFSKSYLENEKHKYINKVLDLLAREEK